MAANQEDENVFYMTAETTGVEYRKFIRDLIDQCGEEKPPYSYRVLPRANETTVCEKNFFVQLRGTKIPLKLIFLERDVYVIAWGIAKPNEDSPGYAIFGDMKPNFVERNKAAEAAAVRVLSRATDRRRPSVRGGIRRQNVGRSSKVKASTSAASPPERDSLFLVKEMANAFRIPFGSTYGELTSLGKERSKLTIGKYALINAFECIYNVATEKDMHKLAENVLIVLQMVPEPMRNAELLDCVFERFELGGKIPPSLVKRQNEWGTNSELLHVTPDDSALGKEWTLIMAKKVKGNY